MELKPFPWQKKSREMKTAPSSTCLCYSDWATADPALMLEVSWLWSNSAKFKYLKSRNFGLNMREYIREKTKIFKQI